MTTRDDFDRRLHTWLAGHEWDREPELLLEEVLARTARTRRRPAWLIPERWISMSAITSRFALPAPVPWRALGLTALLVLALVAGALIVAGSKPFRPAPPFGLAANGALAYSVDGEIVVMDMFDGTPRTVLAGPETDVAPQFAPNGSRLLILREAGDGHALVWTGHDGSDPRVILDGLGTISWAEIGPGGDVVAVQVESEPALIRIVATDGSSSRTIDTGLSRVVGPTFRPPTGDQLTFEGWADGGDKGIYLLNLDGSGLVRLELDPGFQTDEFYDVNADYYFMEPAWSADGTRLAFHTLEPDPASPAGPGWRVHVADVAGDGTVTVEEILEFDPAADDEFDPSWMPTGSSILFHSMEGRTQRVWLADLDAAGPPRDLGVVANEWIGAAISPDGTKILAFVPVGEDQPRVQVVDIATGGVTTLEIGDDAVWQRAALP